MTDYDSLIFNPLKGLSEIQNGGQNGVLDIGKVREYYSQKMSCDEVQSKVPSLNDVPLHQLKTNTLVRYRCMIQDMFDPEYFLGTYTVRNVKTGVTTVRSGMFQDVAHCAPFEEILTDPDHSKPMDRQTFYCVPIPGENNWVKSCYANRGTSIEIPSSSFNNQRQKRSLDGDNDSMMTSDGTQTATSAAVAADNITDDVAMEPTETPDMHSGASKVMKSDQRNKASSLVRPDLNFPLPGENGVSCQVKIYENEHQFKVNDTIEFVGILSVDPAMVEFPEDSKDESPVLPGDLLHDAAERQVRSPPPSLVPRLHVIQSKVLKHSNPLLPEEINQESLNANDMRCCLSEALETRAALLELFQGLLFGDGLAAQYLLCHLISTVYSRLDVVAVGKFSLNISGCPRDSNFVTKFFDILNSLLVKSYVLPMTVDNLNTQRFTPYKDYTLNRLTSGVLQLSANTHLLIDETVMQPGKLDATGVRNLTAVGNMISWQKVEYDFNYHKQDFTCNIPVLVMSEGKSLLKCDCHCPLASENLTEAQLNVQLTRMREQLTAPLLTRFRRYLGLVQQLPYEALPEELQNDIEADFVACRKEDQQKMTSDDLHTLLTLARLLSLSLGQTTLTREIWEKCKQMEFARKQRSSNIMAQTA